MERIEALSAVWISPEAEAQFRQLLAWRDDEVLRAAAMDDTPKTATAIAVMARSETERLDHARRVNNHWSRILGDFYAKYTVPGSVIVEAESVQPPAACPARRARGGGSWQ